MISAVLIAGNMCDDRLWSGAGGVIAKILVEAGLTVCHARTDCDDTIQAMAARALATTAGPLLPIGFSMGGIVALEMARAAPQRVTGLVLADTTCGPDRPERAAMRPGQQRRVRRGALAQIVVDELKPNYLAAGNRGDTRLRALLLDMAVQLGAAVFVAQSEALRTRVDAGDVLDAFRLPILLLAGAEDAVCPPDWHHAMAARAASATVRIIDDAGHLLPLEQPRRFAGALAAWLSDSRLQEAA